MFSAEDLSAAVMADTKDSEAYLRAFSGAEMNARLVMLADVGSEQAERLFSTAARVGDEMKITDTAIRLAQRSFDHINFVSADIALHQRRGTLSDQQRLAATHALSRARLSAIPGVAGAGESFVMGAVRAAAEDMKIEVIGTALSDQAVAVLEEGPGIKSRTLASLFAGFDRGETLAHNTLLVLHEAGMVDAASMSRVLDAVEKAKCKLVLMGDAAQLPPIGPGGAYGGIIERVGHVKLTEVRRQETDWMAEATKGLSLGGTHAGDAVGAYHNNNRATIIIGAWLIDAMANDTALADAHRRGIEQFIDAGDREKGRAADRAVIETVRRRSS